MRILENLNEQQRQAVTIPGGPVLVIAGAGSGKTRVLTHRVAYLIGHKKVPPHRIFVATFTNKAADEMKERIKHLIGEDIKDLWIGTFHSLCARILRQEIERLGTHTRYFTIMDREDQKKILKDILGGAIKNLSLDNLVETISQVKTGRTAPGDYFISEILERYTKKMLDYNALDFDDLLLYPLEIFKKFPEVQEYYSSKFLHVLVDEYQDTNHEQYLLIKAISRVHRNIFVVGDEDQSIYSFRGADVQNILNFEKDYPDCKIIKLEQNYRSTQKILKAATAVINNNKLRIGKTLWTLNPKGKNIEIFEAEDEEEEAEFVLDIIKKSNRKLGDFLILYRINAQSRAFESVFQRSGIPYKIVGGIKFYERKEIKDILAYFKVIVNPQDEIALERIINVPSRGIGDETIKLLKNAAAVNKISLMEALERHREILNISERSHRALENFNKLLITLRENASKLNAYEFALFMLDEIKYYDYIYRTEEAEKAEDKVDNIKELLGEIKKMVEEANIKIDEYIQQVSLRTDIDEFNASPDFVTLMTVHNAKGLEFPVVIITGMEESVFPHFRSKNSELELEEERRLFHVALTRAMEEVYISYAKTRYLRKGYLLPSRFLNELPTEVIEYRYKDTDNYFASSKQDIERKRAEVFEPGDLVYHQIFGMGKVVELYEDKIRINFFKAGLKTLVVEYANLKRVE
ncbi:MAG: UvrD-helicase domain-containing protein [candidate division WOR-3 bacterium]